MAHQAPLLPTHVSYETTPNSSHHHTHRSGVTDHTTGHVTASGTQEELAIYAYHAPWPLYAIDWARRPGRDTFRLAVGSLVETGANKVQVVSLEAPGEDDRRKRELVATSEADLTYPCTKVIWQPNNAGESPDLLATTSDVLRVWECLPSNTGGGLVLRAELCSAKSDAAAPLTSFDWSEANPAILVTCSIDTTCTVWDVEARQAKTQLIAHDREVFDVTFISGSAEIFASVGADGSVRMFDLRSLDHSSIIYEAPGGEHQPPAPLLRLACNRVDSNYLATIHKDSQDVQVLDARMPGTPVAELQAHSGMVSGIAWSPKQYHELASCAADGQVLVWDIKEAINVSRNGAQTAPRDVSLGYTAADEVNNISWSTRHPDWIGITCGRTLEALRQY